MCVDNIENNYFYWENVGMKQLRTLLTTMVLLFGISTSTLADFNDGYDASQKGDYKTAFNEWQPLAKQGNASAQYNLGVMYDNGEGVLKDDKVAVKWYQKAADQGNAYVMQVDVV